MKKSRKKVFLVSSIATCLAIACCGKTEKNLIPSANPKTMDKETKELYDNWQELKKRHLRLIPVPKKIAFKGASVKLPSNVIIVLKNKTKQCEIAANEIISRIKELTGKSIPVKEKPESGAYNIIIENKWPNFFSQDKSKIETKNPYCRKQAYIIEPVENGIKLAGNSPVGMMYAAVTLRYLIGKDCAKVVLFPAKVVDWPDYPRRMITSLFAPYHRRYRNNPEKYFARMKKFMDWAFRLKINFITRHTYRPYYRCQSSFNDKLNVLDGKIAESAKLVSDYLEERGIGRFDFTDVALAHPQDKDKPGIKDMLYNPCQKKWYSWARHDLHRKKADLLASLFSKTGMSMINVHSIDGGGFRDPELWSKRDKLTREKYGNDRGKASLDMFKIYIDAFKKKGMETRLVVYPYQAAYIQEEFALKKFGLADLPANRKQIQKQITIIKDFLYNLNKGIPKDVPFCVREAKKNEISGFYNILSGRPMSYSLYPKELDRDIMPLLPAELSAFWSGFFPDRKVNDIVRASMQEKFNEQASVCASEYTWNTKFPGWSDLDRTRNPVNYDQAVLDIMAERAAVGLWGDEAGQDLKDLFNSQLSFYMAYAPKETTADLNLKTLLPFLKNNYTAALKAEKAMDKVWSKQQKDKSIIDNFSYPIFITYYKMLKAAVAYSAVNYYVELGNSLARKGDIQGAEKAIETGERKLDKAMSEYLKTMSEIKGEPELVPFSELQGAWRRIPVNADSNLLNPDFKALAKKLDDLNKNKEAIFHRYNLPIWLDEFIKGKKISATKTQNKIKIDGVLNEDDWKNAVPLEHFIGHKALKMPPYPVVARVLYDNENIYLSGTVTQLLLPEKKDEKCDFSECMEFFLLPDKKNMDNYFQFAVDPQGNVFSMKKEGLKINRDWKSEAKATAVRKRDKWSFELALPFKSLGKVPGKDWSGMICYNRTKALSPYKSTEAYSSNNVEGKSFHSPEKFQDIRFIKNGAVSEAGVNIVCIDPSNEGKTHESGSGSMITFSVSIDSKRPLYDVELRARFLDKNGKSLGEDMILMKKKYLPLAWKSTAPFKKQLLEFHKGIVLEFVTKYKTSEGNHKEAKKEFIVGDKGYVLSKENAFVEGIKNGTKGISSPFYINNSSIVSPNNGEIEFWVKLNFEPYDKNFSEKEGKTLFFCGPRQPDFPTTRNKDAMSIIIFPRWGSINFQIRNHDFKGKDCNAYIRNWKKNEWHHLAFVWNLGNEPVKMNIYIDGKLASKPVKGINCEANAIIPFKTFSYTPQFGCMNTGIWHATAFFDELRFSKHPKSKEDFTSHPTISGKDRCFSFENNFFSNCAEIKASQGLMPK